MGKLYLLPYNTHKRKDHDFFSLQKQRNNFDLFVSAFEM